MYQNIIASKGAIVIKDGTVKEVDSIEECREELERKTTLYLIDIVHQTQEHVFASKHARILLVSSPNVNNFEIVTKLYQYLELYMPAWSLDELMTVAEWRMSRKPTICLEE